MTICCVGNENTILPHINILKNKNGNKLKE